MKNTVTLPRTITVLGYTATINVKFTNYGNDRYYASVSETAKALKAIAKAAGFNVLRCKSQSYSGGDSVDIYIESTLTPEEHKRNGESRLLYSHPDYTKEPRRDIMDDICRAFEQGKFDGMDDSYKHRKDNLTVEAPNGTKCDLDTKYCFNHFTTAEEFASWQ